MTTVSQGTSGSGTVVVMPTYEEVQNIRPTLRGLFKACPHIHVLVVDDNSPDGTGQLAEEMSQEDKRISVLHRSQRRGLGPAYVQGFQWALSRGYRYVCEMDMDGSHRPQDLARVLGALVEDQRLGLVIGSRRVQGGSTRHWPWYRDLVSRLGSWYARAALGLPYRDLTGGLRAYRAEVLRRIPLNQVRSSGYIFQVDMVRRLIQAGGQVKEVPIVFIERVGGHSKMGLSIVLEAIAQVTWWGLERRLGPGSRSD